MSVHVRAWNFPVPLNQLTKVPSDTAKESYFKRMDALFKRMCEFNVEQRYSNMDLETANIYVYSDASFATNIDLNSQLFHVILLVDDDRNIGGVVKLGEVQKSNALCISR